MLLHLLIHPAAACCAAKDHPYTPPCDRVPIDVVLRTAAEYTERGGSVLTAADAASPAPSAAGPPFRTCAQDTDPIVATFESIITPEEAMHLIEHARPKMKRAGVTTDQGTGGRPSQGRTNDSCWLRHDATPQVWSIVQKIAEIVGLPSESAEDIQVIHYDVSQEYRKHWDACAQPAPTTAPVLSVWRVRWLWRAVACSTA
jgi:hypothetical protein